MDEPVRHVGHTSFNSIKVRLNRLVELNFGALDDSFNSIKVRLNRVADVMTVGEILSFNSIKVRLNQYQKQLQQMQNDVSIP